MLPRESQVGGAKCIVTSKWVVWTAALGVLHHQHVVGSSRGLAQRTYQIGSGAGFSRKSSIVT